MNRFLQADAVFFAEEVVAQGSIGRMVADQLLQNNFGGKFRTRTVPDRFLAHASVDEIFDDLGLTGEKLAEWIGEELR